MPVPTIGILNNQRARDNRRVDFLEKNLQAQNILSPSGKQTRGLNAPIKSGSGRIGRMSSLIGHTKDVTDSNQPSSIGECAWNVEGWAVDYGSDQAAVMGLVIVENTDGTKICVSRVAY